MSRTRRLVEIVRALKEAGSDIVTAQSLSDNFGVSLRTIYRDMSALMESGVPIDGEAGSGYRLTLGEGPPPPGLTWSDAEALWRGARLLTFIDNDEKAAKAQHAMRVLEGVLGPDRVSALRKVHVLTFPDDTHAPRSLIDAWLRAKDRGLPARIIYVGLDEVEESLVGQPSGYQEFNNAAVLSLSTANGVRLLRADRIKKLTLQAG